MIVIWDKESTEEMKSFKKEAIVILDDDCERQFPIAMSWFGWQETPATHGAEIGIGGLLNLVNKSKELCMELVDIKWQKWKVVDIIEVSNDGRPDQRTFIFG